MDRIKFLHEGKIVKENGISTSLLLAEVGSFRKKTLIQVLSGGHGIMISPADADLTRCLETENALQGTHSADTNFRLLDGWPLALLMAPMSKGVQVISSLDKSTEDLPSYPLDLKAVWILALSEETREIWEEAYVDVKEECALVIPMLLVEGVSTKKSIYNCIFNAALSKEDPSSEDRSKSRKALLYISPLSVVSLRDHSIVWRSLCPLLKADKDCVAVKKKSLSCVKLLFYFKAKTIVQNLRKHGPTHMTAFQGMCLNLNFASMALEDSPSPLQKNQVINKETGNMLPDDEFDGFSKTHACYSGDKTPSFHWHFVSRKCSAHMAKIKSQCVLIQDSKSVPKKHGYMSSIFVGCLTSIMECGFRTLTACSVAELGHIEKASVTGFKRDNVMKPLVFGFLEFETEEGAVNAKDHILGEAVDVKDAVPRVSLLLQPKCILFPEPLSFHLIELPDSVPDHKYPIYSPTGPTANLITGGFSHLIDNQQVSQSNAQSQQGNNWCSNRNAERVPIFIRQISGKLVVLMVNLDEPSEHMKSLYEEKTKMKFTYQYFEYERKMIEPDHTLLFYGIRRNSTVHACGRLLGGVCTTLSTYVHYNRNKFLKEVALPSGQVSLKITKKGCRFLNTWLKCFTTAFSMGQSWNGDFTLDDFKNVDDHILIIKEPSEHEEGSMKKDFARFALHVEEILHSNKEYLISRYPPYLKNFTRFLRNMTIEKVLSAKDKLFLETHVCCTTSHDRERLAIKLYRRYEGLNSNDMTIWADAIENATCPDPWDNKLSKVAFFKDLIKQAIDENRKYSEYNFGAFTLIKDVALHATDYRKGVKIANVNGIELMVPAHLEDFLPSIIRKLIDENVDISEELFASKIKCFCKICESADSSDSD